jgi:septum formation protein
MKKIILASQSPWRKKLLSWIGLEFEVRVSDFDERSMEIEDPRELVKILAEKKAEIVAERLDDGVVVGADTVIILPNNNEVIGKPKDIEDARRIFKKLRGREHIVLTGVCVLDVVSGKKIVEVDETRMNFGNFSDSDLEKYLATGDSMGKAGAYQFLAIVDDFVESFDGSVSGVIGIPIKRLVRMLKEIGVEIEGDIEDIMMKKIGYED